MTHSLPKVGDTIQIVTAKNRGTKKGQKFKIERATESNWDNSKLIYRDDYGYKRSVQYALDNGSAVICEEGEADPPCKSGELTRKPMPDGIPEALAHTYWTLAGAPLPKLINLHNNIDGNPIICDFTESDIILLCGKFYKAVVNATAKGNVDMQDEYMYNIGSAFEPILQTFSGDNWNRKSPIDLSQLCMTISKYPKLARVEGIALGDEYSAKALLLLCSEELDLLLFESALLDIYHNSETLPTIVIGADGQGGREYRIDPHTAWDYAELVDKLSAEHAAQLLEHSLTLSTVDVVKLGDRYFMQ